MLTKKITYENFNGEQTSEVLYFNLTRSELMEMEFMGGSHLSEELQNMADHNDYGRMLDFWKYFILHAYGIKSDDGKSFKKSDEISQEFYQSSAYDALFNEIMSDESKASAFIMGVIPKDLAAQAKAQTAKTLNGPKVATAKPISSSEGVVLPDPIIGAREDLTTNADNT